MRDDFSKPTKEILAKRVGFKCSNPNCKKPTVGSHSIGTKTVNIGVASHICAASKDGPRFSEKMTSDERKSLENAIWLCQNCAKLIDSDISKFSEENLLKWKSQAEQESLLVIVKNNSIDSKSNLSENKIKVYEKLYYEICEANSIVQQLISANDIFQNEKREIAISIGLQVAKFTDDNDFYIQDEIGIQCVGTFVVLGEIFSSNLPINEKMLESYRINFRSTKTLLKSVDSNGVIDTTKKTEIMSYYNKIVKQEK